MSRTKRNINRNKGNIQKKRMPSYTPTPSEWKDTLKSYEEQENAGMYPRKKTQHMKDVSRAANRSRKKVVRRTAKLNIKKELEDI